MTVKSRNLLWVGAFGMLFAGAHVASAQTQQPQPQQQQQQQPEKKDEAPASNTTGLTLDAAPPPVNAEEDNAFTEFQAVSKGDAAKKISAGEDFLKKYPGSRYRPPIYSTLVVAYLQTGQTQKALDVGDMEVELKPDDVGTLALLCQVIPRTVNASTPSPQKQLDKAENYGKRALEITPTMAKPDGMTDEQFTTAKNQTLSIAHSGLGLVNLQHGKFTEAISSLETSIRLDPNTTPDPVSYFLLGVADQKAAHFDAAVAAFTKCANIEGALKDRCKASAEEAKKQGATQLSAPN